MTAAEKIIDITPILGLRIDLRRGSCPSCGACNVTVGKGAAMHAASLRCVDCDKFRGWAPKALVEFLLESVALFGRPTEPVSLRDIKHALPETRGATRKASSDGCAQTRSYNVPIKDDDLNGMYEGGGEYYGGRDVPGRTEIDLTAADVNKKTWDRDGKPDTKLVLSFKEPGSKLLSLNTINYQTLREELGTSPNDWVGSKIRLYGEHTPKGRGVRIRVLDSGAPF
jgi:hypothetical protein